MGVGSRGIIFFLERRFEGCLQVFQVLLPFLFILNGQDQVGDHFVSDFLEDGSVLNQVGGDLVQLRVHQSRVVEDDENDQVVQLMPYPFGLLEERPLLLHLESKRVCVVGNQLFSQGEKLSLPELDLLDKLGYQLIVLNNSPPKVLIRDR